MPLVPASRVGRASHAGLTVRDLPASERPRERLVALGAEALSEQELLCCILGRGIAGESVLVTAQRLLKAFGDVRGIAEASVEQLAEVRGVGPAKAVQLKASAELARRVAKPRSSGPHPIDTAEAAAALLQPRLAEKKKEHFLALLLDARHHLIRISPIAVGSLSASLVHPRELFKEAIAASAACVIIAHNHPSGDPAPSEHDVTLTKRLVQAGKLLGIEVLDHLVIGSRECTSLKALGLIT
ncbi:MAG: DNA repair protein RadC [Candidatus Omnitrophica bacterium]|nr:DNA repair protein RadC [Candidatus Omnitrophota bacterium]